MVYRILSYWISFVFPTFYKRIQIKNLNHLNIKAPMIIAMNHPNAFTDPVGLSFVAHPNRFKFLARGDVFKSGIVSWVLDKIGIIPIFRIQDQGKDGLLKNEETYNRVNTYLKKGAKIIVFAEGLCIMERRLRPLKKGVARMVFGAYEFLNDENLVVVPVGVNYSQPDKFRSDLFYNVGEPIFIRDFLQHRSNHAAKNQNEFIQFLQPKLKALITHINTKNNDVCVTQAEELCKKDWLKKEGFNPNNLEHDFIIRQQITEKINEADKNRSKELELFKEKAKQYFQMLAVNDLRDWLIHPDIKKLILPHTILFRAIILLIGSPLFLTGFISNSIPHQFTFFLTKKLVKNREFFSSFTIAFAMLVFLFYYGFVFFIVYAFSTTVISPILTLIPFMLCAWFNLHYIPYFSKTLGLFRVFKNKVLYNQLSSQRKNLMTLINKF